jgi:HD-GYP domain-containing protein (c-di-GMP phosphodiesterase class II)
MIKRIPLSALKVGMYITDLNNDWIPHNTNRRRGVIRNDETIEKIGRLGVSQVYIDTGKGIDCAEGVPITDVDSDNEKELQAAGALSPTVKVSTDMEEELRIALQTHQEAQTLVGNLMQDVKFGRSLDLAPVETLAENLRSSVFRNQNALLCLGRIREKDNYLLQHSVNLSVLMSIFGKSLHQPEDSLNQLIIGALLHDIGKILTPDEILHKPGRLTPQEFTVMKQHASHSRDLLRGTEGIGELTVLTAAQHHERMDGTGYPDGLKGEAISVYGRMAAIADVYDAITSDRVYHKGMTPSQGLKKLLEWSGDHLDPELVRQFVRCIGLYPVGSLVLLESGRLGVVVAGNDDDQRLPVVKVMYHTRFRMPIRVETIDLSRPGSQDRIERAVDPKDYSIDVRKILV